MRVIYLVLSSIIIFVISSIYTAVAYADVVAQTQRITEACRTSAPDNYINSDNGLDSVHYGVFEQAPNNGADRWSVIRYSCPGTSQYLDVNSPNGSASCDSYTEYTFPSSYDCLDSPPDPIPECNDDQFYDSTSGECVEPPDLCYDDIVTGEQICEPMWPDETPEQCVMNDGVMLCLPDVNDEYPEPEDPDLECIVVDGVYTCNKPNEVCGVKNGTYQCVNPQEEGCGYFNGQRMCFDPEGDPVPPDSPDHPDNGGNLDGDPNNDVTDNRTPEEGGDPNKQPGYIPPTGEGEQASEKTARDTLNESRKIADNTKKASDALAKLPDQLREEKTDAQLNDIKQNGASGSWADPETGTAAQMDGHIESIGGDDGEGGVFGTSDVDGLGSEVTGLIPQGTCTTIGWNFKGHIFQLPCDKTQKIRDMLSWVLYFLTAWFLFDVVTSPAVRRA